MSLFGSNESGLHKRIFVAVYEDLIAANICPHEFADRLRSIGIRDTAVDDMFTAFSLIALEKGNVTTVSMNAPSSVVTEKVS